MPVTSGGYWGGTDALEHTGLAAARHWEQGCGLQPSLLRPACRFYIYFSLSSFAVAVVNLPFSKFNKKLIEKKKKKGRKVISSLTIKGQLTSQFSGEQEKKSGIQQEKLNSPKLSPWRFPDPQSQGCCVPYCSLNSSRVLFSHSEGSKNSFCIIDDSALRGPWFSASRRCHSAAPPAPIMLGQAARFPLSPNTSLSWTIRRKELKQKLGDAAQWWTSPR